MQLEKLARRIPPFVKILFLRIFRRGHQRCSIKKVVLRNFTKIKGKHLCQSPSFNKVAALRSQVCNFIKKETLAQEFSCAFCEIFKNIFFTEHLWVTGRLLLYFLSCISNFFFYSHMKKIYLMNI